MTRPSGIARGVGEQLRNEGKKKVFNANGADRSVPVGLSELNRGFLLVL
jgi:hypothetical protein